MEGESTGYQIVIALLIAVASVFFFLGFFAGQKQGAMQTTQVNEYLMDAKVLTPKENCSTCPEDDPMIQIALTPVNRHGDPIPGGAWIYIELPSEHYYLYEQYNDPLVKGLGLNETIPIVNKTQPVYYTTIPDLSSFGSSDLWVRSIPPP